MLRSARVEPLHLPARSPNLNAYAKRFVRTIRQECLNRMVFFREASLRRAMEEFVTHYQLRAEPSVVGEQNHSAGDDGVSAHRADPLPKTTRRVAQLLLSRGYWMKKAENHAHMMAIYFMHYNFVRIHQTLKITPAMAAGVTDKLWEMSDMVKVLEAWEQSRA